LSEISLGTIGGEMATQSLHATNNSQIVGNGIDVAFTNTQANPDRTFGLSCAIDPTLIAAGVDPSLLGIYQNTASGWVLVTSAVTLDPVTGTVQGEINAATALTDAPLSVKKAGKMSVADVNTPRTMAALNAGNQIKKNPHASSTVAATFAVGVSATIGNISAVGYHQYNFPNPFNLKDKTVTLRAGTAGVSSNIHGTYIVVAPTGGGSPEVTIRIYNVAGDMVREIKGTTVAGHYNYFHWDGKNTAGTDCASGVYFARVDAPGAPKKEPIKMVLVK
jgi:hypothetical protein